MKKAFALFALLMLAPGGAAAQSDVGQQAITYAFDGSFDDALFSVENAILNRGVVIEYTSHVGDMLSRTAADMDSYTVIFDQAQIFLFCSAAISRRVTEADPMNIVHCP